MLKFRYEVVSLPLTHTEAIRSTPLASGVLTNRTHVSLRQDIASDVQSFLEYTGSNPCSNVQPMTETITRFQVAETLYRGDFLQDFHILGSLEWDDWQSLRRIEFEYRATCVIAALTHYYVQQGLVDSGLRMAHRWLHLDPHNEEAHHLTMQLYAQNGQSELALQQYYLLARLMEREYGRPPGPEVQHTLYRIRAGDYVGILDVPISSESTKAVRSLLPKPVTSAVNDEGQILLRIKPILNTTDQKAGFIMIFDEDNTHAPDFIAQVAHNPEIQHRFRDGILWASLQPHDELDTILRLWLDAMRVSILRSTSKLEHLAWQFHNGQRGKRLLFLLENVRHTEHVHLLKPGYAGCTLIMTTSSQEVVDALLPETDAHFTLSPITADSHSPRPNHTHRLRSS